MEAGFKEQLKQFIIETFLFNEGDVAYDTPLFESGIIDSLGLMNLLVFIDRAFGVSVEMSEITIRNFNSINDIAKIIEDKLSIK